MALYTISGNPVLIGGQVAVYNDPVLATPPNQMPAPVNYVVAGVEVVTIQTPTDTPVMNGNPFVGWLFRYSTDVANWTVISLEVNAFPHAIPSLVGLYVEVAPNTGKPDYIPPWSAPAYALPSVILPPALPLAPPKLSLVPGDGQFSVDFPALSAVDDGGGTNYRRDFRYRQRLTTAPTYGAYVTVTNVADPYTVAVPNGNFYVAEWSVWNETGQSQWSVQSDAVLTTAPLPETEPPADVVLNPSNFVSTMTSWKNNWNGTIPPGKTASSPRYIDLQSGNYGGVTINSHQFPANVYVRSQDKTGLGAKFDRIYSVGSHKIKWQYITIERTTWIEDGSGHFESCSDCSFEYGYILGPNLIATTLQNTRSGIMMEKNTRFTLKDTLIRRWCVSWHVDHGTDITVENNLINDSKGDDSKVSGTIINLRVTRNWSSLIKEPTATHTDYHQHESRVNCDGYYVWGNILYAKCEDSGNSLQGFWMGSAGGVDLTKANCRFEQNFICTQNKNIKWSGANIAGAGSKIDYCTGLFPAPMPTSSVHADGSMDPTSFCPKTNCIEARWTSITLPATNIKIDVGANKEAASGTTKPNYTNQHDYYTGPITRYMHATRSPLTEIKPKSGTQAHWGHSNPKGFYLRAKEVYVDGVHPGNSKNQVLANYWRSTWNKDSVVTV